MRASIVVLAAASHLASAGWLRWSENTEPLGRIPQKTGTSGVDATNGWTPRPTTPPGSEPASRVVLDLLRRQTTNTWENNITCGWYPSSSSAPWTCEGGATCATNTDNVVACVSGTFSPFYTACFNYQAYLGGACSSIGTQTGCCQDSSAGSCGTFLWTGSHSRSMYGCFPSATIVNMLDEPQFVVDAATRTSSSSTTSSTPSSSTSTAPTTSTDAATTGSGGGSTTNMTVIIGAVVGGIALLALLAVLIFCCLLRRRRKAKNISKTRNVRKQDIRVYNIGSSEESLPRQMT